VLGCVLARLLQVAYRKGSEFKMPRSAINIRESLGETLDRVVREQQRVIVRRNGKNVAALVPLKDLAALEELEDRLDAKDFQAAKKRWERSGKKTVAWETLKAELGL
jgi:prevent-host-death family protein